MTISPIICEQLADSADASYTLVRSERTLMATALRELAEIRRREEGRALSRPATASEIAFARDAYEHPSNADCTISSDARARETEEEVRVEASVLVRWRR